MRTMIVILSLLASLGQAAAQETRNEVTRSTTPAEDSKPNSDAVPDVQAFTSQIERVVLLRFKNQADILEGIQRMVKEQKIQNAVILSGIGSVRGYHYHMVSNTTFPSKNVFVKNPSAPADIASMNGHVIDGRVHAHITFANADGAFGGHLEPGTITFTFAIVTIGVFRDGLDLSRVDDKNYR
ncbi:MAG: DNA-binding protein [Acidobacteria bacterium]|nr:MAG: DNA-binding protein [Acidobacteriota bacterium]